MVISNTPFDAQFKRSVSAFEEDSSDDDTFFDVEENAKNRLSLERPSTKPLKRKDLMPNFKSFHPFTVPLVQWDLRSSKPPLPAPKPVGFGRKYSDKAESSTKLAVTTIVRPFSQSGIISKSTVSSHK